MKTISFLKIFLLLTFVLSLESNAQIPLPYQFEHLDVKDGLSHGQINCFFKDSRGYVWIGTSTGLNLYNGYSIKTFNNLPGDAQTLNANDVERISEDPEGNIWVSTYQGIGVYNPVNETFSQNIEAFVAQYQLPNTDVFKILKGDSGQYWFLNENAGVTYFNAENGETKHIKLSTSEVSDIQLDGNGDLWAIHTNGLLQKIDHQKLQVRSTYSELAHVVASQEVDYQFNIDADGHLWIYQPNYSRGVYFFEPQSGRLTHYSKNIKEHKLDNDLVTGVVEVSPGIIWVGTNHGGINVIDKKQNTIKYLVHHPEVPNSLSHNSVYSLYKDEDDIIWVGTYKNGINFYHKNIKRFNHYKHLISEPASLPYNDINRFVEDDEGNLWMGTNGGGLLYFNRQTNTFKQYKADPNDPNSLSSDVIVSLLIDKDNVLWVGTYLGGLNRFNGKGFDHFREDNQDSTSISDDNVWELLEDSFGNLWVGTLAHGVDLLNPDNEQFTHYDVDTVNQRNSLHSNYILALEEDANGNIWVGGGNGVDVFNPKTGYEKHFLHDPKDSLSLASNTVLCLLHDSENRMWMGTQQGLNVYSPEDGLFRKYTTQNGLPHNTILTILEANANSIWVSTPNGLSNIELSENGEARFINYDESDGLQGRVFNENAAYKTYDGKLIFGGPEGFNIFDPDNIGENDQKPEVVFTDFQLFNKSVEVGAKVDDRVLLTKSLSFTDGITLNHDENVFSIEFAALNFLHAGKNKYKYKLEGFDKQWRTTSSRKVTYTNLDPGNYTFKVLASNNDGLWNDQETNLSIQILPPFWKTTWAYALYAIIILGGLYLTRSIILQRERMKFQIEQERREARQLHELDLLKIRFFTNVSHEFRTPLSLILAPLEKLLKNDKDDMQSKQYQMIHRNARRLLNLVNQLLDFRKLEVDTIDLHTSEGNIVKFIEESVHSFSDLSENKNVELVYESTINDFFASFDMDKLEKILFNLLSNAFKFTPQNGKVHVQVNAYESDSGTEELKILEVKVSDTGIGISKEQQELIFDRFFRSDTPGSVVNQGSGIGLSITKEFVKIHGGTVSVESEPGEGTCFTVRIPVKTVPAQEVKSQSTPDQPLSETVHSKPLHDQETPLVLLVEDSEDFRFYLKDNLGVHFKIIEAKNGKDGWQKALANLPDLIVSDLSMPEMNGVELCEKVKLDARTSHIPFVLLTAHSANDKKLKGLNVGADDYVTKPFNFEILLSRVKNLIQQRQAMQAVYKKKITVETSEIDITSLDDKLIQDAIKVVEENISNPDFSVEQLSRELGMSRTHLYKKMVAITGKTPVEFIRKIRLERAAQFLQKSQLTVAEVAYKVGFNNRKYFSKYFKMEYNILPSAYADQYSK
ncbi:hybrid sensor histidine kinase/response regulator transcription factor [Fulvivirga ligni]|uniref:hybrid sensor histidine kinase/response regulator transcription factor n=1 Tax=Fulvivirga ligni TaxID=2904246 RepID=UPI001F2964D2|nr:two-component regulator propeller domain-containing protein [Fulvivirga ligni]UII23705.1 ATP-binding protein [Fulvivirga ligni]